MKDESFIRYGKGMVINMDIKSLRINPTLACGNLLNYKEDLDILKALGNKILHIDVMDGHYVPNLCFDLNTIKAIKNNYDFLLDVHLMVTNPEDYVEPLKEIGVDFISFHIDATSFSLRLLKQIRELGIKAGIVINPSQSIASAIQLYPYTDFVLLMAVEPGFSGQQFIPETIDKIEELNQLRKERGYDFLIEVDGGINHENSISCIKSGADILVSGAFGVFERKNGLMEDYRYTKSIVDSQDEV